MAKQRSKQLQTHLEGYPEFVTRVLRDWKVNGAAVAVAKDGEIVLCQGFGLRDVEQNLPVTEHTLFPQASVTKAFTAMSIGVLADEGLLSWDRPVRDHLPGFRLWDQFATERMTPRDLVTHRSGLPRHDLMWYHSHCSREELVERLRHLKPTTDFRAFWQYQNLMYVTAGYLVGKVAGSSWEDVVQSRIFDPLGMVSSSFSIRVAQQAPDFSLPYMKQKKQVKQIPFYEEQDAIGPAGAIVSNVGDMSRWLLLHLGKGQLGERRLFSEGQITEMHSPQVVAPGPGRWPEMPHQSYGLGWFVEPYRGRNMLHHGGNIDGFSTLCTFMPDEGVGVVALTNMSGSPVPYILSWNIFDRFLGLDPVPWSERFKKDQAEVERAGERGKEKRATDRVRGTRPSHPLEAYTGLYADPGYGMAKIRLDGRRLVAGYNNLDLPLRHYHYDTFEMRFEQWDVTMRVQFLADARGDITRFSAPLEPTVDDIVFTRVPDEELTSREFLERFTGVYDLMNMPVTVSFKGDVLQISLPRQPKIELVPLKGTEFRAKETSDFSVEFKVDQSGSVKEAAVSQMGMVFTLTKREG